MSAIYLFKVSFSPLKENSNGPYSDIHTEWIFTAKGMSSMWNESLVCLLPSGMAATTAHHPVRHG